MKKICLFFLLSLLACTHSFAQYKKSVSILGDSYSTYEGYIPAGNVPWYFDATQQGNDVNDVTLTWWHKFISGNGLRLCMNNSYSGATVCNTGYDKKDYSDRSFITRMSNLGDPDVIFIFGGTNDSWAGSPLGEYQYGKWKKEDLYKFRPAMAYMLDYMTKRYINVDIYFLINTELKEEIDESVKTICKHYGVEYIELQDIDKIAGHPSVKGMQEISRQIEAYMAAARK